MAETTIATGIYTIENVDRRNDIFLADDGRGTLVAGSSEAGADPPWEARWKIIQLRNGRYFISPAAQQDQYASWPSNFSIRSAIVASRIRNDWVIKEAREKQTFVISHVQHQLYWGIEDDAQGTPVRLRHAPTGSGNQWKFHCLSSTMVIPQRVIESPNIDESLTNQMAAISMRSQRREVFGSRPASSIPVVPQNAIRTQRMNGSEVDYPCSSDSSRVQLPWSYQTAATSNLSQTREGARGRPSMPTPVVPKGVAESRNIGWNVDDQTANNPAWSQTMEEGDVLSFWPTPFVPQSVVESRTIADGHTTSTPSETRSAINSRPAIRHVLEGHTDFVYSVAFSPDGEHIVSGSSDCTIRVWDVRTRNLALEPIEGHTCTIYSVAFSPDGKRIISGSADKTVRIWDAQSGTLSRTLNGHTNWVMSVACSPDGKRVVSGSHDKTVRVWDVNTGRLVLGPLLEHTDPVTSVHFSLDGKQFLSGSWDTTVRVWDAQTGHAIRTFHGQSLIWSATFSPDSKQIVAGDRLGFVRLWDMQSGNCTELSWHETSISVAFSPDGGRIVSCGEDTQIIVWDVKLGNAIGRLSGHTDDVLSVVFSPDGQWIASGSADKTVRIWEADRLDAMPRPGT